VACQNQRRLFKLHAIILNHKSSESNFLHVHKPPFIFILILIQQPLFPLKTDCAGAQAPKPQSPEGIPQRSGGV